MLAAVLMPFTFSITKGIAIGFMAYVAVKTVTGSAGKIHPTVWILAILSLLYYIKISSRKLRTHSFRIH